MTDKLTLAEAERLAEQGLLLNANQRLYQLRHAAQGLCHSCGEPATRGRLCQKHADEQAKRRAKNGSKKSTCKKCGGRGHYQKTCKA